MTERSSSRQSDSTTREPGSVDELPPGTRTAGTLLKMADTFAELATLLVELARVHVAPARRSSMRRYMAGVTPKTDDAELRARDASNEELPPIGSVHLVAADDVTFMLCGLDRVEVPAEDRITAEPARVTCALCAALLDCAGKRRQVRR